MDDGLAIRCITTLPTLHAEDEGLEPPRPWGRRFSKPLSYQLELILHELLAISISKNTDYNLWFYNSIEQVIDQ